MLKKKLGAQLFLALIILLMALSSHAQRVFSKSDKDSWEAYFGNFINAAALMVSQSDAVYTGVLRPAPGKSPEAKFLDGRIDLEVLLYGSGEHLPKSISFSRQVNPAAIGFGESHATSVFYNWPLKIPNTLSVIAFVKIVADGPMIWKVIPLTDGTMSLVLELKLIQSLGGRGLEEKARLLDPNEHPLAAAIQSQTSHPKSVK